jgi:hypothetical protein
MSLEALGPREGILLFGGGEIEGVIGDVEVGHSLAIKL